MAIVSMAAWTHIWHISFRNRSVVRSEEDLRSSDDSDCRAAAKMEGLMSKSRIHWILARQ